MLGITKIQHWFLNIVWLQTCLQLVNQNLPFIYLTHVNDASICEPYACHLLLPVFQIQTIQHCVQITVTAKAWFQLVTQVLQSFNILS
jgi:hypothetical protein